MKSRVNVITSLLIVAAFLTIADTNIATANINVYIAEVSPDKICHQDDLPDTTITLEYELPVDSNLIEDDFKDANIIIIASQWDINDISIDAILQGVTFHEDDVNDSKGTPITITTATITVAFDTDELMDKDNLPEDYYGTLDLQVKGQLESGESIRGNAVDAIAIVRASDYISEINFDQIWDYGDPSDSTDLMYEFRLEIDPNDSTAVDIDDDILMIKIHTPAGLTIDIPKKDNKWPDPLEYKARFTDQADLQDYDDGEYTITLHLGDGMQVQTTAWFGNPYTERPILQPTHEPVLSSELQQQPEGSLVTFNWQPCEDPNVDEIYIIMLSTYNNELVNKDPNLDFNETSWGPILLLEGSWQTELIFSTLTTKDRHWQNPNEDGIQVGVAKSSRCRSRITVEDAPWNIYEVWGGNIKLDKEDYSYIDQLEAYGYEWLGQSDGNRKFSGQYGYYLIATMGQCFIDSIQGSDANFCDSSGFESSNISNENYLLHEPDELCATLGSGKAGNNDVYNGFFAFENPNDWKNLTTFTLDRNLDLDKSILSVNDETKDINSNDIDPNDIITYSITFDTDDFPGDPCDPNANKVHNIKIVDILSDHVIFEDAFPPDSNEVTGSYDPIAHTYTWQYPTVDPETSIGHRLTVRIDPDTLPGTTITNFVTIDSIETAPSIARIDAAIPYEPLNITKSTIDRAGNEIDWIESGKEFIYQICFDNNNNGPQVGDVNLVDLLPFEVRYVSHQSDNPNFSGSYDANDHSFKGTLDTLEPGLATCLKITVEVNEDTPNIIINNAVAINSNETPDANDAVDIEVIPPLEVEDVIITPDILSRAGTPQHITAVIKFPAGSDIDPENIPELYYQDRETGDFILIGYGSRPVLSGTQITTLFNRAELMDAIYGYGEFTLAVVGQLKSSLTFYGYANIHISKFTGN